MTRSKGKNSRRKPRGKNSKRRQKLRLESPPESLDVLLEAVRTDPDDILARLELGEFYLRNDLEDKILDAIAGLEERYPFSDKFTRGYYNRLLAFGYAHRKQFIEAEKAARRGLEEYPYSLDYYFVLSYVHMSLKELDQTIAEAERFVSIWNRIKQGQLPPPDFSFTGRHITQLYNILATAYRDKGKMSEARRYYEKSIEADPGNYLPYVNLANLLKQYGELDRAEELVQRGLSECRQVHELRMLARSHDRKATVSACMIVKDEEELLPGCLESIRDWVDEIVVVDTGSTDRTVEIAESYGARIFHQPWEGNFSKHRNYSIELANSDWIFTIDADERVYSEDIPLLLEIINTAKQPMLSVKVYNVSGENEKKDTFLNSIRLFKRELNLRYDGIVHNELKIPEGKTGLKTDIRIKHLGYGLTPEKMREKFLRTKTLLEKQLEGEPDNTFALFNYAQHLRGEDATYKTDNSQEILEVAGRVIELTSPDKVSERHLHLMSLVQVAETYSSLNDYDKAIDHCYRALKAKSNYLDPLILLGFIHSKKKEYNGAIKDFKKYLEVQEQFDETTDGESLIFWHLDSRDIALGNLGLIYEIQNDIENAKYYYHETLKVNPRYKSVCSLLGRIYLTENNITEARKYFLQQIELSEKTVEAVIGLAEIHAGNYEFTEATKYFDMATALFPDNPIVQKQYDNFQHALKTDKAKTAKYTTDTHDITAIDATGSIESLLDAVRSNPEDVGAVLNLAEYYNVNNQVNKVIETLKPLEKNYPIEDKRQRVQYNRLLAFSYVNANNLVEAEKAVRRGLRDAPESLDLYYVRSFAKWSLREYDQVIKSGTKYLQILEKHLKGKIPLTDLAISSGYQSQLYNFLGSAYQEKRDFEHAGQFFQRAIQADPENHIPYENYAWMLKHEKKYEEAGKIINDGIRKCRQVRELQMMIEVVKERAAISACMIVKNEEELLPGCLESIRDWVDEIIVVDTGSTDRTVEIAKSYRAKLFHQPWDGNFSKHRNYSIEQATGDWIFIIDADERFSPKDVPRLLEIINSKEHKIISINVFNYYREIDLKATSVNSVRFFRRDTNLRYEGIVHNTINVPEGISITRAPFCLEHLGYDLSREKMKAKFKRTKYLLEKQIKANPNFAFAWFNLAQLLRGELFHSMDDYAPQVLKAAHKAVKLTDPHDSKERHIHLMALDQLAWTYFYTEKYDLAERYAGQTLKHKENYLDPLMLMGHIYSKTNRYREALKAYNKYLEVQSQFNEHQEIDPLILYNPESRATAYYGMGTVSELLNDPKQARHYYLEALRATPNYMDVSFHVGRIYLSENNFAEAEKYFIKQLETGRPSMMTALGLATMYFQRKQHKKAERYFQKALEFEPTNKIALVKSGQFYFETGQDNKAAEFFEMAIKQGDVQPVIYKQLAELYFRNSHFSNAAEIYKKLLKQVSDSPELHNDLGNCYYKMGEHEQAEESYRQALETGMAGGITHRNLGLNRVMMGKYKEAIIALEKYLEVEPNEPGIFHIIGDQYVKLGAFNSAITYYEKVLTATPYNASALFSLSECYLHMGHRDSAVLGYQRVLQLDAGFKPAQKRLTELAEPAGRA